MFYRVALIGILLFSSTFVNAQSSSPNPNLIPKVVPPAPTTASLGKYGDYETSFFTGVPQINIPLYEIDYGGVKVPISLNYHASGIKVTDISSWVGLGWALDAGGDISRRMMGAAADESSAGYMHFNLNIAPVVTTDAGMLYLNDIYSRTVDAEPDIFSYSFPGKSGKFFLNRNDNYEPVLIPYAPVVMKKTLNGNVLTFRATDETGNVFVFGETAKETTESSSGGNSSFTQTSWKLDKILTAASLDTINFTYTQQGVVGSNDITESWGVDDKVWFITQNPDDPGYHLPVYQPNSTAFLTSSLMTSSTPEVSLSTIEYKNGRVTFELSPAKRDDVSSGATIVKSLNTMKVWHYDVTLRQFVVQKIITFYQSYFTDPTDVLNKRLRLDSLGIAGADGVVIQKYRFGYNTDKVLPVRTSKAIDYWGYYNGKPNSSLIPRMDIIYTPRTINNDQTITIGSNIPNGRDCDEAYMQAGILKTIWYPTGGRTDFQYETNKYLEDNVAKLAGGLRIRSIKSYPAPDAVPIEKTYVYGAGESGYGRKNFFLNQYYFSSTQVCNYFIGISGGMTLGETKNRRTFTSNSSMDILPWDAATVVYPLVTEYVGTPAVNAGKTVHQFTDHTDAIATATMAHPVISSFSFLRGLPSRTTYYQNIAGNYQIAKTEDYSYGAFNNRWYDNIGMVVTKLNISEGQVSGIILPSSSINPNDIYNWLSGVYSIYTGDTHLTDKVVTTFDQNNPSRYVTLKEHYDYGNIRHQQVTKTLTYNSEGEVVNRYAKFPADFLVGSSTGNAVLDSMVSRNYQAIAIETRESLQASSASLERVTGAQLNIYSLAPTRGFLQGKQRKLAVAAPITNFVPATISAGNINGDSRYTDIINYSGYDVANNITEFTSRTKGTTSFLWDYNNTLPVAEVQGAPLAEVAFTSFEAEQKGNFQFTGVTTVDSTAPTGTRCYNLGQTNGTITRSGLLAASIYRVSYWTKNTTAYSIAGTQSGYPVKGRTVNGWSYYEHKVSGVTAISLAGTGYIDELRCSPLKSGMTTYTYRPGLGMTSVCSPNSAISRYEYDVLGRLKLIRDQYGSIVKTFEYNYKK